MRFTTVPRPYGPRQAREFLELVGREWEASSPISARSWAIDLWPSRKVAWRCGFRVEGTVRGFCPHPGGAQDAWIGSSHRDDLRRPCEPWPSGG
jgi:hypothetical protein